MKEQKFGPFPILAVTAGGTLLAVLLRIVMLHRGYDADGIQIPGHWSYICLLLLSVLTAGMLFLLSRQLGDRNDRADNLRPSAIAGGAMLLSGVLLFLHALMEILGGKLGGLDLIVSILGLAAGCILALWGPLRKSGKVLGNAELLIPLYLALRLLNNFRDWSRDPLLGDFIFALFANLCAMLAVFYLVGFCFDLGKRKITVFFSMISVFFCGICLADPMGMDRLFYGALLLLLLFGGCSLQQPTAQRRTPEKWEAQVEASVNESEAEAPDFESIREEQEDA